MQMLFVDVSGKMPMCGCLRLVWLVGLGLASAFYALADLQIHTSAFCPLPMDTASVGQSIRPLHVLYYHDITA